MISGTVTVVSCVIMLQESTLDVSIFIQPQAKINFVIWLVRHSLPAERKDIYECLPHQAIQKNPRDKETCDDIKEYMDHS
jgi:hypothetical protein